MRTAETLVIMSQVVAKLRKRLRNLAPGVTVTVYKTLLALVDQVRQFEVIFDGLAKGMQRRHNKDPGLIRPTIVHAAFLLCIRIEHWFVRGRREARHGEQQNRAEHVGCG